MASLIVQSIHAYSFDLPLAHPFFVRSEQIKSREGMIIHVISERGVMGFGEMSPLPGISRETFGKAVHQLELLVHELKDTRAPMEPHLLLEWLSNRMPDEKVCPSVKFGLESAIINMIATANEKTVYSLLRPGISREVFSAGLLQGTPADIQRQARFLCSKGYRTFKLKVGSRNIPLDIQKVDDVRRVIGPSAMLRLDANQAWRLDEALLFAEGIGKQCIEYIEEPLANPFQLEEFYRRTDMPIALDETLSDRPLEELSGRMGVAFVVARPMTMGGVTGYMRFLDNASQLGSKVVLASAFESGVGMTMLANLAAMTQTVSNLGTANWFEQDLVLRPLVVESGRIPADRMKLEIKYFHSELSERLQAS